VGVLKSIGSVILGIIIFLTILLVGILLLIFGTSLAATIAPYVIIFAAILFVIDVIFLFLAIFPPVRRVVGITLFISSYVFGMATWIYGLAVTLSFWGIWGVVVGLLLGGVGVVPLGMIASAFNGHWDIVLTLVGTSLLTIIVRILGYVIAENGERYHMNDRAKLVEGEVVDDRKWEDVE
jgi:hypothetical protein